MTGVYEVTSFIVGCSTLITFAPSSAKNIPTEGPANTVERSITVREASTVKFFQWLL